jgi:hypothetical protein
LAPPPQLLPRSKASTIGSPTILLASSRQFQA